ncbi:MAG: hypothetical protein AVDCRST_MAG73-3227 [uncultured Thermomicrobiales bacterium]|uniref:Regulator of polyketide synthase expression n=1 Tax=uncultured Thermomicrobiales bacterium TaxID=1645740 RepID=A0A6J4UQW9_9BACT|nr:MAG: hypothetical protein AVDCRST_MAG73-3227 [uncultured Thermomicrobiales bacterium]
MITVGDVIRLALPEGTRVAAGRAGLDREVTWATRLRATPPAFGNLAEGELVLLPAGLLAALDERLTLGAVVRQLAGFKVAGIAHAGPVPAEARTAANKARVPLLELPPDADLARLEQEASLLITQRRRAVQRRGQEVGRRLMELAIAGEPLSALVRSLGELAGRTVALEDRIGAVLAVEGVAAGPPGEIVADLLAAAGAGLGAWLRVAAASSSAEPPTTVAVLGDGWARVVAPVIGREGLLGTLSLVVPRGTETPEDAQLTSRGAAACAVVLARDQAAASARREVELNVLDEILDGALRAEASLLRQARQLGHDLGQRHVALVARLDQTGGAPARSRDGRWATIGETLARTGALRDAPSLPLWRVRHNSAELVWPVAVAADAPRLARAIRDDLAVGLGDGSGGEAVALGYGRPRAGLAGIRQSHHEAKQALALGRRLHGPGHLTGFDDLGIHRLIFAAEGLPELRAFHDETLAPLIAYDRQHGAELVRTLDAFFAANAGPKEAAARLGVHRNTVLYRLDRVREITGLDLDDADVRLRLALALRVHLALFAGAEEGGVGANVDPATPLTRPTRGAIAGR